MRLCFLLPGLVALVLGTLIPSQAYARYLWPSGHITEVVYLTVLRSILTVAGTAWLVFGALAGRQSLLNITVMGVAIFAVVGSLETGLRIKNALTDETGPGKPTGLRASPYPGLIYENTPLFHEFGEQKFNSLGLRDDERPLDPTRPKIVVVGDSIEAWRPLPAAALYPRVFEKLLDREYPAQNYQVVNLGVTGYSIHQKMLMLRYRGLPLNPRLIVVGYCLNDPFPAWELVRFFSDEAGAKQPVVHSELLSLVNERLKALLHSYGMDFYQAGHRRGSDSWMGVKHDIRALGEIGRERRVPIVLMIFPLMEDTRIAYPWIDIHRRVAAAARSQGLKVIDLLPAYRAAGFDKVRTDSVHPDALGHRLAGEALLQLVVHNRLLGQ
ncbi:MAG TPA: GDSL-type esterase/lipase family protein [Candidatus Binatia bacterium]|nr:GDSL-type esterase/lipase family protein [Candidatus Binatia bacterium]